MDFRPTRYHSYGGLSVVIGKPFSHSRFRRLKDAPKALLAMSAKRRESRAEDPHGLTFAPLASFVLFIAQRAPIKRIPAEPAFTHHLRAVALHAVKYCRARVYGFCSGRIFKKDPLRRFSSPPSSFILLFQPPRSDDATEQQFLRQSRICGYALLLRSNL